MTITILKIIQICILRTPAAVNVRCGMCNVSTPKAPKNFYRRVHVVQHYLMQICRNVNLLIYGDFPMRDTCE